ncbi:hypothetical protein GH714_003626 [Hevea brasiliensis]|uniref:Beta-glucosidase n=1 Tax=Hevea brasiliensis TaxID=3981 RepID=A0A6A6KX97_HEVBR|nr:hypothetical protein GH714_003626 [Hevea brasiliensis]
MATKHSLQLLGMLFFLISLLALTKPAMADEDDIPEDFNHDYFPKEFIFGTATSAYQEQQTSQGRVAIAHQYPAERAVTACPSTYALLASASGLPIRLVLGA